MKIVLTGATGLVGTEVLRLALSHPNVTEVIALARRPVSVPEKTTTDSDMKKLRNVVLEDFGKRYPEDVMEQLRGVDACIWNLSVTPRKARGLPAEEVKKICLDYTLVGLRCILEVANPEHSFRFIYTSGSMTERDQSKALWLSNDYRKMRGDVENRVLNFASNSDERLEAQIARPSLIDRPGNMIANLLARSGMPSVDISQIAAAELHQAITQGPRFGRNMLENADLVRIGRGVLDKTQNATNNA